MQDSTRSHLEAIIAISFITTTVKCTLLWVMQFVKLNSFGKTGHMVRWGNMVCQYGENVESHKLGLHGSRSEVGSQGATSSLEDRNAV